MYVNFKWDKRDGSFLPGIAASRLIEETLPSLICGFSDYPGCGHSVSTDKKREETSSTEGFYEAELT